MLSLEFPLPAYTSRVFANLGMGDFIGGLFKGMVFSFLVAGVGCLRGLETGTGPTPWAAPPPARWSRASSSSPSSTACSR
jgi:hypothetical protein